MTKLSSNKESMKTLLYSIGVPDYRAQEMTDKLIKYVDLLSAWSGTHNIISRNFHEDDLWQNIYDSMPFIALANKYNFIGDKIKNNKILDAGAGGGFPSIPLSIVLTETEFTLVDSDRKKCSFLRAVKAALGLNNVVVINSRLEDVKLVNLLVTKAAFSPEKAPILANALEPQGKIIIWSTRMKAAKFVTALSRLKMPLIERYDYLLSDNKERSLLLFEKT